MLKLGIRLRINDRNAGQIRAQRFGVRHNLLFISKQDQVRRFLLHNLRGGSQSSLVVALRQHDRLNVLSCFFLHKINKSHGKNSLLFRIRFCFHIDLLYRSPTLRTRPLFVIFCIFFNTDWQKILRRDYWYILMAETRFRKIKEPPAGNIPLHRLAALAFVLQKPIRFSRSALRLQQR